ncbi:MAG TPA: PepSY-associated TM helix domain-containing protein, partial [Gemmatimonadales bacterium]
RRRGVRDRMRVLHRALGLAAGLLLVVTGLSGSALVFRAEIDAALNPHLLRVVPAAGRAPLEPMLERVRQAYPDEAPTRLRMPQRADGTYEVWLGAAPSRYVYADPYRDGAILGARRPTEFLTGWLFLLHSHMLAGETGHLAAGVGALVLVLLSISGLVAWWPRRAPWRAWRQWRAALTVMRGAGVARTIYDLHRAVGLYASALLLMAGITGASLVFHEAFERAAHWVTASAPPARTAPVAVRGGAPYLPADTLLAIAERAQPGGMISYLYFPAAAGQTFRVRKRLPGEEHPNGKSFVHVDPSTGRVLLVENGAMAPRGARLYSILYPLHIGVLGGTATRLLAVAVGLSLPLLAVTGAAVWWRRGRRRTAA